MVTASRLPEMYDNNFEPTKQPQPDAGNTKLDLFPSDTVYGSLLKFSHLLLGHCDPLCGHTPPSPYNSSRTPQHASSATSKDPPVLSSPYSPSAVSLCWIQNLPAGKQGCKGIHTCTAPGHCPGQHTPACSAFLLPLTIQLATAADYQSVCASSGSRCLPPFSLNPSPTLLFLLKYPVFFYIS